MIKQCCTTAKDDIGVDEEEEKRMMMMSFPFLVVSAPTNRPADLLSVTSNRLFDGVFSLYGLIGDCRPLPGRVVIILPPTHRLSQEREREKRGRMSSPFANVILSLLHDQIGGPAGSSTNLAASLSSALSLASASPRVDIRPYEDTCRYHLGVAAPSKSP